MSFLQGIRENFGRKLLHSKAKKVDRRKTYNNLESAQTVGILFDATSDQDIEAVRKFASSLDKAGKRIDALGMLRTKAELSSHTDRVGVNFFAAEECSLLCYPKSVMALQFISQKFDILLNLCPESSITTDYIVSMSRASFKVSSQLDDEEYADFILQFGKETTTAEGGKPRPKPNAGTIINAIKQYLSNIAKA